MNKIGMEMYGWAKDLFPICRSLTGDGVIKTLNYIQKLLPSLTIHKISSGTKAFDWVVPDEWNINDAYISDLNGNRVVDFNENNLHVVGYSIPIDKVISFEELDNHLYSIPDQPKAIPYITSYYNKNWGFCLSEEQRVQLRKFQNKKYQVKIDSTLKPGYLTYGEIIIPGKIKDEIFISTYICHPSMANNELSGICVTTALCQWIENNLKNRKYTYRIVFIPETIGSLAYLSKNLDSMKKNIKAGFVLTCIGDNLAYSYLESRNGNTLADRVAEHVLKHKVSKYNSYSFLERGSDERQYCSPGIDLPVCSIMRSKYGTYPEYHTSLDDLSFISSEGLQGGFEVIKQCIEILENNEIYKVSVLGEPQLGKRGLYPNVSTKSSEKFVRNMMNFIAYADGFCDLIDIADKIDIYCGDLIPMAEKLQKENLLNII
jgi:aminopeptidase-like protein